MDQIKQFVNAGNSRDVLFKQHLKVLKIHQAVRKEKPAEFLAQNLKLLVLWQQKPCSKHMSKICSNPKTMKAISQRIIRRLMRNLSKKGSGSVFVSQIMFSGHTKPNIEHPETELTVWPMLSIKIVPKTIFNHSGHTFGKQFQCTYKNEDDENLS